MRTQAREVGRSPLKWLLGAMAVTVLGTAAAPAEAAYVYREIGDD